MRYLFGPGRANDHTRPHLVASWLGDDPGLLATLQPHGQNGRPDVADLAARLALALPLQPDVDRPVWQCSMRTAPGDRVLSDRQWAHVARDVVHRVGLAPDGDPGGCRWVAVRHADDHVHIAVVLARVDGHPVSVFRDWPKVHAAARAAERRLGLQQVTAPARTTHGRSPTRAEHEKTTRTAPTASPAVTSRRWLTEQTRAAAATATSLDDFAAHLAARGVLVTWRHSHHDPTQVTGYAVARPGDHDPTGHPIWFGGSKLAADLSLPRLAAHWHPPPTPGPPRPAAGRAPTGRPAARGLAALRRTARAAAPPTGKIGIDLARALALAARAAPPPRGRR